MRRLAFPSRWLLPATVAVLFLAAGAAWAQPEDPGATTRRLIEEARQTGAKGTLPNAWWDLEARVRISFDHTWSGQRAGTRTSASRSFRRRRAFSAAGGGGGTSCCR